jgi:hypothetical protein
VLWIVFILPETYAPVLLTRKAQRLRRETGDDRYQSPMERNAKPASAARLAYDLVASPFVMLVQEPMLLATSVYCAFVFGNLYLCLAVMPLIFVELHGWNLGQEGLAFLGIPFGASIGWCAYRFSEGLSDKRQRADNVPIQPEICTPAEGSAARSSPAGAAIGDGPAGWPTLRHRLLLDRVDELRTSYVEPSVRYG